MVVPDKEAQILMTTDQTGARRSHIDVGLCLVAVMLCTVTVANAEVRFDVINNFSRLQSSECCNPLIKATDGNF